MRRDLAPSWEPRGGPGDQFHGDSKRSPELLRTRDDVAHDLRQPKQRTRHSSPPKGKKRWHQEHTSASGRYMLETLVIVSLCACVSPRAAHVLDPLKRAQGHLRAHLLKQAAKKKKKPVLYCGVAVCAPPTSPKQCSLCLETLIGSRRDAPPY